jgi:zinc transport system substrate-binding protein
MKKNEFGVFGFRLGVIAILCLGFVSALGAADKPLNVYTVNYPLKYFAERIGGDHVRVTFPVPPDVDPAYWVPGIAAIGAIQRADLILLNGAGYAKWVPKVSLPRSKTVDTARQFKNQLITVQEVTTHSHGAQGKHAHEDLAFTTWLDFSLATEQARAVSGALIRKRPQFTADFEAGYTSLAKELMQLDRRIKTLVASNLSLPLLASHPVYDYLERRYGLTIRAVHWEPDQNLTKGQLHQIALILATQPARWMIWENEPLPATVQKLATVGIGSTVFNPCGNVPERGDFLTIMRANIANLESVFR